MKIFFRRIHLYLGLAAGAFIFIACLTGALLVFQKELEQSLYKSRYYTAVQSSRLPADTLVQRVRNAYPKATITGIKIYSDAARNAEVNFSLKGKETDKKTMHPVAPPDKEGSNKHKPVAAPSRKGRAPGVTAFIDPYTGQIKELYNSRESFFFKVMSLHRWLLGTNDGPGKYIVGISTFIFVFITITGIILWWPATKNVLKQRLKIKTSANWKRLNHDLHIVLGFYSAIFLFVFAFTALPMSFQWFNKGIYAVTNSPVKNPEPPKSVFIAGGKMVSFDRVISKATAILPDVTYYTINMPGDSAGAVAVSALSTHAVHETAPDAIYLDQYSGALIGKQLYKDRTLGARVRSTFRPVHVGSIWGMPSKIIALIVCLLGANFPVTGVIMWLNRTRKKKKDPSLRSSSTVPEPAG